MLKSVWWIETTEKCNLHCRFCYNAWRDKPARLYQDAPRAELLRILEYIADNFTAPYFILSGGDVSASHDFELFAIQVARLARTALVTNGETISAKSLRRFYSFGIKNIQFSVQSHKEATHRFLTGGGNLRKTIMAIESARSIGIQASIVMVLTRANIDDVYGVIYLASQLDVSNVVINPLVDAGRAKRHGKSLAIQRTNQDLRNLIMQLLQEANSMNICLSTGSPFQERALNKLFATSLDKFQSMKLIIDAALNVKPCSSASLSFGRAIELIQQPDQLVQQYLQFWKNPPALEGCTCTDLFRQQASLNIAPVTGV